MSVCPTQSIQVAGLNYDEFIALPKNDFINLEKMLSSRRSVRSFKDRSIEPEVLDRVIRASAMAPIGAPPPTDVQVLVLDEKKYLDELYRNTVRCWKK